MPIIANAKKALRQTKTRTVRNKVIRAQVRTVVKKGANVPSASTLSSLFSTLDRAVKRRIIHKNKAARLKAHASKQLLQSKIDTVNEKPKLSKKKPIAKKAAVKKTAVKKTAARKTATKATKKTAH